MVYAGFFARLAAFLLDWCILLPCLFVLTLPMGLMEMVWGVPVFSTAVLFRFTAKEIVRYCLVLAYFVILTYKKGGTLGKQAMNLKVVMTDGRTPDLFTVFYRECIGKFLSSVILYIGYFLIGADAQKASLHDKLADTRVIYVKKIKVYPVVQRVARPAEYSAAPEQRRPAEYSAAPEQRRPAEYSVAPEQRRPAEYDAEALLHTAEVKPQDDFAVTNMEGTKKDEENGL